ncbi:class A beta-lactamase [Spirosoma agri]|uniref:beta-lactamase n=1 Tax=Spirosoma agri TaxID=1987381 RepID=A0A6M0IJT3_9BACT|nr:class A beta-lactamase [Spirosoma agri]NEU68117.1 class A beta-lactamase [Spirosoma agri]
MLKYFLFLLILFVSASLSAQPKTTRLAGRHSLDSLRSQLERTASAAQGKVGVAATLLETGESIALQGDQRFPMQSVYKLPIAMVALHLVDQGKLTLDQPVRVDKVEYVSERQHSPLRDKSPDGTEVSVSELLRYAVSESDGSASDVLMRLVGGPNVIMTYLNSLGIKDMIVANTEKELGADNAVQYRNWAKPTEAVALLRLIQQGRGLSESSRALLLRIMTETETGLHRLKGQLPAGTVVAHKTGTSWTIDGLTAATNDIGLITLPSGRHIALAVFVSDARADQKTREAVIANLSRTIWNYWNK